MNLTPPPLHHVLCPEQNIPGGGEGLNFSLHLNKFVYFISLAYIPQSRETLQFHFINIEYCFYAILFLQNFIFMSSTLSFTSPSLFLFPLFTTPFPLSSNLFSCPVITPFSPSAWDPFDFNANPDPGSALEKNESNLEEKLFFGYFYAITLVISFFQQIWGLRAGFCWYFEP